MRIAHELYYIQIPTYKKINPETIFFGRWEVLSPPTYGTAFKNQGLKSQLIPFS